MEHQYDLTQLIWSSEDMYTSTFYVTVTATVGGNQSEPAASSTFTFNNVETAAITCESPGGGRSPVEASAQHSKFCRQVSWISLLWSCSGQIWTLRSGSATRSTSTEN